MLLFIFERDVGPEWMKLQAGRFNCLSMIFARRNQRLMTARLQLRGDCKIRMKISERAVGCENDALWCHRAMGLGKRLSAIATTRPHKNAGIAVNIGHATSATR